MQYTASAENFELKLMLKKTNSHRLIHWNVAQQIVFYQFRTIQKQVLKNLQCHRTSTIIQEPLIRSCQASQSWYCPWQKLGSKDFYSNELQHWIANQV